MLEAPPGSREDLVEVARTPCTPTELDTMLYGYTNSIYVLDHTPESLPDIDMLQLFASPAGRALVRANPKDERQQRGTSTSSLIRDFGIIARTTVTATGTMKTTPTSTTTTMMTLMTRASTMMTTTTTTTTTKTTTTTATTTTTTPIPRTMPRTTTTTTTTTTTKVSAAATTMTMTTTSTAMTTMMRAGTGTVTDPSSCAMRATTSGMSLARGSVSAPTSPHARQRRSSTELYMEAVEILGLTCTLSDSCRCIDCQSNYFDYDDEYGEARTELAAGTPILLDHALTHPLTCSIQ